MPPYLADEEVALKRPAHLPVRKSREYAEGVVTDLEEIRRLGEAKEAENLAFRRFVAEHHHRVEELQAVAAEVQRQIDCTTCANCCRWSVVTVSRRDIEDIATYLKLEPDEVVRLYTRPDPEDSRRRILRNDHDACVFLDGNLCTIYEARPKACRDFPHLAYGTHSIGGRVESRCRWASLCPIVYNALENYKHRVGFHPERHHK